MEINNTDFQLKYNLRSMFIFEEITGKAFKVETLFDTYILLYSCILSNNDNPSLEFDDLIDYCSDHPEVIGEFNAFMDGELKKREMIGGDKKKAKKVKGKS